MSISSALIEPPIRRVKAYSPSTTAHETRLRISCERVSSCTPIEISTPIIAAMVASDSTGNSHIFTSSRSAGVRRRSITWETAMSR